MAAKTPGEHVFHEKTEWMKKCPQDLNPIQRTVNNWVNLGMGEAIIPREVCTIWLFSVYMYTGNITWTE